MKLLYKKYVKKNWQVKDSEPERVPLPVQGIDPGTFITGLQGKLFEFRAFGSGNMSMPALSGFSSPDQVRKMFRKKLFHHPAGTLIGWDRTTQNHPARQPGIKMCRWHIQASFGVCQAAVVPAASSRSVLRATRTYLRRIITYCA